jgi:hypothetical protein
MTPPITNAAILRPKTFFPSAAAASSLSRTARIARPSGEPVTRRTNK